jgi:hypothetical protein
MILHVGGYTGDVENKNFIQSVFCAGSYFKSGRLFMPSFALVKMMITFGNITGCCRAKNHCGLWRKYYYPQLCSDQRLILLFVPRPNEIEKMFDHFYQYQYGDSLSKRNQRQIRNFAMAVPPSPHIVLIRTK